MYFQGVPFRAGAGKKNMDGERDDRRGRSVYSMGNGGGTTGVCFYGA